MDGFPSGQRGQTVNLLAPPSKVRILLHPYFSFAAVAEQADAQDLKSCGTYTPVPVRFRSAAVGKSERNVEFTAFLLFFCFKKLMKLDLIDSVAMEEVAGFLDKLLSKDKYEGRREANMKYVVEEE